MRSTIYSIMRKHFQRTALSVAFITLATTAVIAQDENLGTTDSTAVALPRRAVSEREALPTTILKGYVVDMSSKAPLAGVQIKVLGNDRYSTMSEEDGAFEIKVPTFTKAIYVFSPEYLSQQIAVNTADGRPLTINMLSDKFRQMYDQRTPIRATNSFTAGESAGYVIDNEIQQELGGDIRSIQRSAAPAIGNAMFIRGLSSINASCQPLIIVDGVEQDMQVDRTALHTGQYNNLLSNIQPSDIEDVQVLKNGTALYGARGAGGVIIINTKRGHSMATRIDADIAVGLQLVPRLPTMMNATQYRNYASEMLGTLDRSLVEGIQFNFLNDDPDGYYYNIYHNNTDWSKEVYRSAMTQNYSIVVQGGDNVGMYNLSAGYTDAESTVKGSDFNRMNVRFNTDISIIDKLSTRFDISLSRTSWMVFDDGFTDDFSSGTITSPNVLALIKSPLVSSHQYNQIVGGFTELLSDADEIFDVIGTGYSLANPVAIIENASGNNKNYAENTYFNVAIMPRYEFTKSLSLTEHFSYSLNRNSQRYSRPYNGVPTFEIEGLGTVTSMAASLFSKEMNIVSNTRLDYKRLFSGKHSVEAYVGFRYNYFSFDDNNLSTQYTGETSDKNPTLSASSGYQDVGGNNDIWKILQLYGNADYNYLNRYFASLTLMGEANSRFGENASGLKVLGAPWAIFPGLLLGWVITNEDWFPKNPDINYLRLTVGYEKSGNDDISNYAARTSFTAVKFNYHATGLQLTNIGNDEIQWETTNKLNVGLHGNFLNNRLSANFDIYLHKTNNLLTLKTFDNPIGGINNFWSNGGKLENRGIELSVNGKPIVTKNWLLEIGANLSHYNNEVTELPDGDYTTSIYGDNNILTAVGHPVALFYGYKTAGVFSTDAEAKTAGLGGSDYLKMIDDNGSEYNFTAGDIHFVDLNGDGYIDEDDRMIIGDPNPDIYGNIFGTLTWKNLSLMMNWNYSLGNDVYNYERSILNSGSTFYNQQVETTNHWRFEGQVTDQPRLAYGDPMGNNRMSDRWIEDGSYLRLKTLRLSYNVPLALTWLQGLNIWVEGTNIVTLTKYLGSDPEFSISNNVLYQGIDCGNVAQGRAFTAGIKINL